MGVNTGSTGSLWIFCSPALQPRGVSLLKAVNKMLHVQREGGDNIKGRRESGHTN